MIDVRELERRWLRYKIKKTLPFAILAISAILIFIILINIDFSSKSDSAAQGVKTKNTTKKQHAQILPHIPVKTEVSKSNTLPPQHTTPSKVLKPSMDFLCKIKDTSTLSKNKPIAEQKLQRSHITASDKNKSHPSKDFIKTTKPTVTQTKKAKVEIKISKISKKDLQDVIKRFKKSNNPALGVFIAKKYYELKDYQKAYNYALITNQIDSTIEDSWIIFAKSLIKLGQKERAIDTLKAYIKTSNSKKAQILLENIMIGKFQ